MEKVLVCLMCGCDEDKYLSILWDKELNLAKQSCVVCGESYPLSGEDYILQADRVEDARKGAGVIIDQSDLWKMDVEIDFSEEDVPF